MSSALKGLEALVSDARTNGTGNSTLFFFTNGQGETVPIVPDAPDSTRYLKLGDREHPDDADEIAQGAPGGESEDYLRHPSLLGGLNRERRRSEEAAFGLEFRRKKIYWLRRGGHHFGGYHARKDERRHISVRYLGEQLGDVYDAAELFRLPVHTLALAHQVLTSLETQRAPNGNYR